MISFKLSGAEITFSFWFFAVMAIFFAFCPAALIVYAALPVAVHELGHIAAMVLLKVKIRSVRLTAFGIELVKDKSRYPGTTAEIAVSLAGAAANLAVAGLLYAFTFQSMRSMLMVSANIAVAVFNLLPVGNLDGGEAAKIICGYFFRPGLAYTISRIFSLLALAPLFAAAIFLLLRPERNFTLLLVCIYLLIDIMHKD